MASASFIAVAQTIQEELDKLRNSDADTLSQITPKHIRVPVVNKLGEDLNQCRGDLNVFITALFQKAFPDITEHNDLQPVGGSETSRNSNDSTTRSASSNGTNSSVPSRKRKRDSLDDEAYARNLQAYEDTRKRASRSGKAGSSSLKKKSPSKKSKAVVSDSEDGGSLKKTKRARASNPNTGFNKPMQLSAALANLVGEPIMSRPKIVKALWDRIKTYQLQNPEDKREIFLDQPMQDVFKMKKFTAFSMNKHLTGHVFKIEDPAVLEDYLARAAGNGASEAAVKNEEENHEDYGTQLIPFDNEEDVKEQEEEPSHTGFGQATEESEMSVEE